MLASAEMKPLPSHPCCCLSSDSPKSPSWPYTPLEFCQGLQLSFLAVAYKQQHWADYNTRLRQQCFTVTPLAKSGYCYFDDLSLFKSQPNSWGRVSIKMLLVLLGKGRINQQTIPLRKSSPPSIC